MNPEFSVILVTNGRNPELLRQIVTTWLRLGAEVVCAGEIASLRDFEAPRLKLLQHACSQIHYGDARQAAINATTGQRVLVTDDDIIPLERTWSALPDVDPDAIQSIRLTSVAGQRWGDWCYFDGVAIYNQSYNEHRPGTYITGGSMLIGKNVLRAMSWRGRTWHAGADVLYCWEAERSGYKLLAPKAGGPELCHMDRLPPHQSDPDRLHIPLLTGGPAAPPLKKVELGGVSLLTRAGSWDVNIAREVIEGDFYLLNLWQPIRPPQHIVDVGAHIGSFAKFAGQKYPDAKIVACEAMPLNALIAHINTRETPNIHLRHLAVSNRTGVVTLQVAEGPNTGGHAVSTASLAVAAADVSAPCISLRELKMRHQIDGIDFLKLDCEGSEWEIVPMLGGGAQDVAVQCLAMELHLDAARGRTLPTMEKLLHDRFDAVHVRATGSPDLWRIHAMNNRETFVRHCQKPPFANAQGQTLDQRPIDSAVTGGRRPTQLRAAACLSGFVQDVQTGYSLVGYQDPEAPTLFMGVYCPTDVECLERHVGLGIVWFAGTDTVRSARWSDRLNALDPARFTLLCEQGRLGDMRTSGIRVDRVHNVFAGDPSAFGVEPIDGARGIHAYCPSSRADEYGFDDICRVARAFPERPFYVSRWDGPTKHFLPNMIALPHFPEKGPVRDVYRKCSHAIRLTRADGFPASTVELALMGRPSCCFVNHELPWIAHAVDVGEVIEWLHREVAGGEQLTFAAREHAINHRFLEI